ncbi:hypothetical protein MMC31_001375 [Peltigera leucophlebia]|nr:hypothetical protein [Peltigera leucophlebia]
MGTAYALKYINPRNSNSPQMRLARGMAYGAISGILSAHSLLVAKSAVELLVCTIVARHNQFNRWESWVIVLGLIALALSQLYYLHLGLKLCSTSILYPFVFCVYNIIAILDGLIYFRQTSQLSLLSGLLIALGTVILLGGVLCLSWRLSDATSRTPVSQSSLTPGMGLVDTEPSISTGDEDGNDNDHDEDEEAEIGKELKFFTPSSHRYRSYTNDPRTPINRNNNSPNPRPRRKTVTESQEIWEELEDASPLILPQSPWSPPQTRSASLQTTPSKPPARRNVSNVDTRGGGLALDDEIPEEDTPLLGRSGTGRTYRDRRRRRSAPQMGRRDRDESQEAQAATGGWWKMAWWNDSMKGKGRDRDDGA